MTMMEFAAEALRDAPFRLAKTMPKIPHEYTRRSEWNNDDKFEWVVMFIRENGVKEKFWQREFTYLYVNGYKYWTMGSPIEQTILINRAKA